MKTESQKLRDSIPLDDEALKVQLASFGFPFERDGAGAIWASYAALDHVAKFWKKPKSQNP